MATTHDVLVDLLSQLDENKFRRLFRHLIDNHTDPGYSRTLNTPNSFVFARYVKSGAMSRTGWFFNLAYVPYSMCDADVIRSFCQKELRQALTDLRHLQVAPFSGESVDNFWHDWIPLTFTYHLVTNIIDPYVVADEYGDSPLTDAYQDAELIFKDELGRTFGPSFTFGSATPLSIAGHKSAVVRDELIRYLNAPSSYSLIAREGRMCVVPTGTHGLFFASDSRKATIGEAGSGLATTICSHSATDPRVPLSTLSALESLLNSRGTKEADLQDFFEQNPDMLLGLDDSYTEIRPHVFLIDRECNTLIPDFMARVEDSDVWDIIELKLPRAPLTKATTGNQTRPSAAAARGIGQLLEYRDYFGYSDNRRRFTSRFGLHGYEPALVLVMGSGPRTYEWRPVKNRFPNVRIVPYEYLLDRGRACRACLTQLAGPPDAIG